MSNMKRLAGQLPASFADREELSCPPFRDADFDGKTYDPAQDQQRLGKQAQLVWWVMTGQRGYALDRDGWAMLAEIALWADAPEGSVSARLRDFRKPRFGGHAVQRRRRKDGAGTWEYRLIVNAGEK